MNKILNKRIAEAKIVTNDPSFTGPQDDGVTTGGHTRDNSISLRRVPLQQIYRENMPPMLHSSEKKIDNTSDLKHNQTLLSFQRSKSLQSTAEIDTPEV